MRFITSSVRRQLIAGFTAVAALFLIALVVGWSSVGSVNSTVQSSAKQDTLLQEATGHARDMAFSEIRTVLDREAFQDAADDLATFQKTMTQLGGLAKTPRAQAAMNVLTKRFAHWLTLHNRVLALARSHQLEKAAELAQGPANDAADQLSEAVATVSAAISKSNTDSAQGTSNSARSLMLILAAIALLAAAAIAFTMSRDIAGRIKRVLNGIKSLDAHCMAALRSGLQAIAGGDLTQTAEPHTEQISNTRSDELGQLTDTFNAMVEKTQSSVAAYNETRTQVGAMLLEIGRTSDQLTIASHEMARTSEEAGRAVGEIVEAVTSVAEGAEDQVRSIAQAKHLTEDVAAASEASAGGAEQTAGAAAQARTLAQEGADAVQQATEAMRSVQRSSDQTTEAIRALGAKSQQIGGIVDTITGIAGADQPARAQRRDRGRAGRRAGPRLRGRRRRGPQARRGVADRGLDDRGADRADPA